MIVFSITFDNKNGVYNFAMLVDEYLGFMTKVAYAFFRDKTKSEEAVQNSLFAISRNLGNFQNRKEAEIKSYIYRIVESKCIDLAREYGMREKVISIDALEDIPDTVDIESQLIAKEELETALRVINSMPEEYVNVLKWVLIDNLKPKEIAHILDLPLSTVYSKIRRGKKLLVKLLSMEADINE